MPGDLPAGCGQCAPSEHWRCSPVCPAATTTAALTVTGTGITLSLTAAMGGITTTSPTIMVSPVTAATPPNRDMAGATTTNPAMAAATMGRPMREAAATANPILEATLIRCRLCLTMVKKVVDPVSAKDRPAGHR